MLLAEIRDRVEVLEGSGVDLARLRADDRRPLTRLDSGAQRIGERATLAVHRDARHLALPDPEHPKGPVDGDVTLLAGNDPQARSALEAGLGEVPAVALEHRTTGGGEGRQMGRLASGHEGERGVGRQSQNVLQPGPRDLLDRRRRRCRERETAFWSQAETSQSAASAAGSVPPITNPK